MNRLEIETGFPDAVEAILAAEELVDPMIGRPAITRPGNMTLWVAYPDDSLSQSLTYWLAMAQGCRLIYSYEFRESYK